MHWSADMKLIDRIKKNRTKFIKFGAITFLSLATVFAVFWSFHSAPPHQVTITAGPAGSMFERFAQIYQEELKKQGIRLIILPSEGSVENLKRLTDKSGKADIGFVQSGIAKTIPEDLVSLGSINYEPIYLFYRSQNDMELLSGLKGKKVSVGEIGSGTHELATQLLSENGIKPGGSIDLIYLDSDVAAVELLKGSVDAVFLMGDSVSRDKIKLLLTTPGIRLYDFVQAEAYTRRIKYLHKLELPMGSTDFGRNIPSKEVTLVGPTIELVARKNLHPAVSDLLLRAATEAHSGAGMLKKRGEFPAFFEEDIKASPDAQRYYKSGQGLLYRELPFWVASMINRILVIFLPLIVIFPSVIRGIPAIYKWRIRMKVFGWYRNLLDIEQKMSEVTPDQLVLLHDELNAIEARVNKNVPTSFADQFYALRGYIHFVRNRIDTLQK